MAHRTRYFCGKEQERLTDWHGSDVILKTRFKEFFKFNRRSSLNKVRPTVVTFTGGMGAQVISAAVYFSIKNAGHAVYADFSYFDQPESIAEVGRSGECSHWAWQLDSFGLSPASFNVPSKDLAKHDADILHDGERKLALGLGALALPEVQTLLKIPASVVDILPAQFLDGYLCIHVRRGDYVNVASHLVADDEFMALARKFSGLVGSVAVISDSPIGPEFRATISSSFSNACFFDNTDAFTAHRIMRSARILICSNSQFSLIAAALNPSALVLIPKQWFGAGDRHIEGPLHARCSFQIMETALGG